MLPYSQHGCPQTYATLASFVLAMVRHPEVLRKARDEIDRLIGPDRLPDFGDRESLPYLNALLEELYRCALRDPSSHSSQSC